MAPLIATAKLTTACPLFASDWDASTLVVGGGGGDGKNGVPNKIILLDATNPAELVETGEIELSKEEDSVTSLAVGQKNGTSTLIYAGVNANQKDVVAGKNTHFRVLTVKSNSKGDKKTTNKITQVSKTAQFAGKDKDIYQRVIRLSRPAKGQPQVAALLSGLTEQPEIVFLELGGDSPRKIIGIGSGKEAVDADFIWDGPNSHLFAFCDAQDVFVTRISEGRLSEEEPTCIYVTPASDHFEKPSIPSFSGLRWLTKDYLAVLSNTHGGNGAVVQILRLPLSGNGHAAVVQSIGLPWSVKKATGFAVANLTPPLTPSDTQGYSQFVIAVAGHDISINLYKLDLQVEARVNLVSQIKSFKTLKKDHPIQITSLAFSKFEPPTEPITAQTPQQFLKLASTSMSNTVVVHTLPLFPVPLSVRRGQSKIPRYVVALPSRTYNLKFLMILSVIFVGLASVFVESLVEIRGGPPSRMGVTKHIPIQWQYALGKQYEFPSGYSSSLNIPAPTSAFSTDLDTPTTTVVPVPAQEVDDAGIDLQKLVQQAQAVGGDGVVIINDHPGEDGVKAHVHDEDVHGPPVATKWEDLPTKQKEGWKKKLSEAGHWAEDMGETLFKGVLFGELAGAVGQAVAGG